MKRLIIFFLIILGSIWLGIKIYEQPGYVLILYRHWAIETTTWLVLLLVLLAFFIFHLLLNLLRGTVHLPKRIEDWWQTRKQHKAIRLLNKGYFELLEGKDKKAEKHLIKSAQNKELAPMSYLLAANAADEQRSLTKRDQYLQTAKKRAAHNSDIIDIMKVRFFLKNHQPEEALSLLISLREHRPKDPYLLKLLAETYLQSQDWVHLLSILNDLKKYKVFPEEDFYLIEKETYLHLLKEHYYSNFAEVQLLWNKIPKHLKHDPEILIAYCSHLTRWERNAEAEELLRKNLKRKFDGTLMEYYVTTRSNEPAKQLALGEKYLKQQENNPASLRAMGMLCIRNRLWGQARDYLERSLKIQATPETYSALGYVYEKLGHNEKALHYYRKGLSSLTPF